MDMHAALAPDPVHARPHDLNGVRLRGKWLVAGRAGMALLLLLCLITFGVASVKLYDVQSSPCSSNPVAHTWPECAAFQEGVDQVGLSLGGYGAYFFVLRLVAALPVFALSALLLWRRSAELPVLLVAGLLAVVGAAGTWFTPLWDWAQYFVPALDLPVKLLGFLLLCGYIFGYTFPDGRFVPRWTCWLAVACIPLALSRTFLAGTALDVASWPAPFPQVVNLGLAGTAVYALAYRYRQDASPVQRQQIKWVVAGFSLLFATWLVDYVVGEIYPIMTGNALLTTGRSWALWDLGQDTSWYVAQFIFAICLGLAVLRHRLWDIDVIINRALVYSALTAAIVGLYVLVVGSLGALLQTRGNLIVSLIATGVVALLVQPLRARLQRGVNRLLYGARDEPYTVLSRLGQRLDASLAPEAALQTITDTLVQVLKLPYAAIELQRESASEIAAITGQPVREPLSLLLTYQREQVGRLILGSRPGEHAFAPSDRRLLQDVAHQAGVAVAAYRMELDLQRSRERLVSAREEERLRLRRDLHDGLGPTLASLFQRLDTVNALMQRDPDGASQIVTELKGQVKTTIADIRRLVYALRPPALDEFGLVGAIREQVAQYDGTSGLRIRLDAPETLPPLPAATEVAAFRIALEALTNVVRHAEAHTCQICLAVDNRLYVDVLDDGVGVTGAYRAGVGINAMRERTAELGGQWGIEPRSPFGTHVWACLPIGTVE